MKQNCHWLQECQLFLPYLIFLYVSSNWRKPMFLAGEKSSEYTEASDVLLIYISVNQQKDLTCFWTSDRPVLAFFQITSLFYSTVWWCFSNLDLGSKPVLHGWEACCFSISAEYHLLLWVVDLVSNLLFCSQLESPWTLGKPTLKQSILHVPSAASSVCFWSVLSP